MTFRECRPQRERDVIREDDTQPEDEASEPSIPAIGGTEGKSDDAKDQTCHRNRKLPVDGHDLIVRGESLALELRGALLQLRDGHLRVALLGTASRKRAFRTDADDLAIELDDLIRAIRVGDVTCAVLEHHLDSPLDGIENDAPMTHEVNRLWTAGRAVRHEHVVP